MNWFKKLAQFFDSLERRYNRGQQLMNPSTAPRAAWDIARNREVALRNYWRNRSNTTQNTTTLPQNQNCALCGVQLTQGGILDSRGIAGRGNNALLCYNDAQRLRIVNPGAAATPTNAVKTPTQQQ